MTASRPTYSAAPPSIILGVAFACFCMYEVAYTSRIFDITLPSAHIPFALSSLALFGAIISGGLQAVARFNIARYMFILTGLFGLSGIFSFWKAGSFAKFSNVWLKSLLVFFIAGALISTYHHAKRALHMIGWGTAIGAVVVLLVGGSLRGRLIMGGSRFDNPNELAFALLLGLPCLLVIVTSKTTRAPTRLLAGILMVPVLLALANSGSRAGLIGFATLITFAFFKARAGARLWMFIGTVVMIGLISFVLPRSLVQRYMTVVEEADYSEVESMEEAILLSNAEGSTQARWMLFMNSLVVTGRHPLFGCGIGQFAPYMAKIDEAAGRRGSNWHDTHNTYTQLSAEAGIPALLVFVTLLVLCFKGLRQLSRRARQSGTDVGKDVAALASAMMATLSAYCVFVLFASVAYESAFPTLAGLTVGLLRGGHNELSRLEALNGGPATQHPVIRLARTIRPPRVAAFS